MLFHTNRAEEYQKLTEDKLGWNNNISVIQHVEFGGPGENMRFWKNNEVPLLKTYGGVEVNFLYHW